MSTTLMLADDVQTRRGSIWAYVSPSRLSKWLSCPLAFQFQYVEGIRSPAKRSLFLGKAVHRGLQVYYRNRHVGLTLEPADVCRRLLGSWGSLMDEEGMEFESAEEDQALQRQAADLVTAYLAHVPKDEKPLAVEATIEMPLIDPATGENLGIPLLGIVDLILEAQHGPSVVDFKTTSRSGEPVEMVHEIQLTSYAYLFRQVSHRLEGGLEIRSIIKTKNPRIEVHAYPAREGAHFRRLFAVLHEYRDSLDSGRFNYRPGFHCGMCDYQTRCRGWAG